MLISCSFECIFADQRVLKLPKAFLEVVWVVSHRVWETCSVSGAPGECSAVLGQRVPACSAASSPGSS